MCPFMLAFRHLALPSCCFRRLCVCVVRVPGFGCQALSIVYTLCDGYCISTSTYLDPLNYPLSVTLGVVTMCWTRQVSNAFLGTLGEIAASIDLHTHVLVYVCTCELRGRLRTIHLNLQVSFTHTPHRPPTTSAPVQKASLALSLARTATIA